MKRNLLSIASGFVLMIIGTTGAAQIPMLPQTVSMGPEYANEIYYHFHNKYLEIPLIEICLQKFSIL